MIIDLFFISRLKCDIIAGGEEDLLVESPSDCDIAGVLSLSISVTVSAGVSLFAIYTPMQCYIIINVCFYTLF